ncbi:MAG: MoaD/ThiS family protein [Leptospirales bacterium]
MSNDCASSSLPFRRLFPGEEEISISLVYFGAIREKTGVSEETVLTTSQTPRNLYQELDLQYSLGFPLSRLRVAVDGKIADPDEIIASGSTVIYLPPFGGG